MFIQRGIGHFVIKISVHPVMGQSFVSWRSLWIGDPLNIFKLADDFCPQWGDKWDRQNNFHVRIDEADPFNQIRHIYARQHGIIKHDYGFRERGEPLEPETIVDRKSTRLNSSH